MQTKASHGEKEAKSTTRDEFVDLMKALVPKARAEMGQLGLQPLFSYDNNRIQQVPDMGVMGLREDERLPLSRYSPDMHKAIEHVFAQLKQKVEWQLLQPRAQALTPLAAQQLVGHCFESIEARSIFLDACSLPATYFVISGVEGLLAEGPDGRPHICSGGKWPARQYR
jgi:hypothetical protein